MNSVGGKILVEKNFSFTCLVWGRLGVDYEHGTSISQPLIYCRQHITAENNCVSPSITPRTTVCQPSVILTELGVTNSQLTLVDPLDLHCVCHNVLWFLLAALGSLVTLGCTPLARRVSMSETMCVTEFMGDLP